MSAPAGQVLRSERMYDGDAELVSAVTCLRSTIRRRRGMRRGTEGRCRPTGAGHPGSPEGLLARLPCVKTTSWQNNLTGLAEAFTHCQAVYPRSRHALTQLHPVRSTAPPTRVCKHAVTPDPPALSCGTDARVRAFVRPPAARHCSRQTAAAQAAKAASASASAAGALRRSEAR